jgi:coenzyme PQQ biosynthesis protein PqqD
MAVQRSPRVTYEVVDGQAVLLDPDGVELITLNAVGTLVWEELDGRRDASELAQALADRFDGVTVEELERDVRTFLEEMVDARLVDTDDAVG